MTKVKKVGKNVYYSGAVSALLGAALALGSVGCAAPDGDGTIIVYAMQQRSLPGCLAAYPPVKLDASKCQLAGPTLEYMAVGCDNGSYPALTETGWREAFSQETFVAAIGPVVDGQASIEFIDGASGTCDFQLGELSIVP